jgi:hypothetical protein
MPYQSNGKRDYSKEAQWEKRHPERKKQRAERMVARRAEEKKGLVHKHDNKQVDHINPLSHGGSNSPGNWRVVPAHENESFARNPDGSHK